MALDDHSFQSQLHAATVRTPREILWFILTFCVKTKNFGAVGQSLFWDNGNAPRHSKQHRGPPPDLLAETHGSVAGPVHRWPPPSWPPPCQLEASHPKRRWFQIPQAMGGFPLAMGVPQLWLVFVWETPNLKWMRTGGYPHFRKPPNLWVSGTTTCLITHNIPH